MQERLGTVGAWWRDPRVRGVLAQALVLLAIGALLYVFISNASANLARQKIATGFGFLDDTAGFGIIQTLIAYSEEASYGRALLVGLLNTVLIAAIGIVAATVLGFLVGVGRLSNNWLIARLCTVYVETLRNLPLLLQLFFWYFGVLRALPAPRQSVDLAGVAFFNNRGIFVPRIVFEEGSALVIGTAIAGILLTMGIVMWSRRRRVATGKPLPVLTLAGVFLIAFPALAFLATGAPFSFSMPELKGFNFVGGVQLLPEMMALAVGLTTYTAAFIAESVRAGILGVPRGQTEAAQALGLSRGHTLRLVVIPQALRIIVPPLTSQYLNLTKNSSLGTAIAYPDLVQVFAGTTLNQTGQAIEIIGVTMAIYLSLSLLTALAMNIYNARIKLTER